MKADEPPDRTPLFYPALLHWQTLPALFFAVIAGTWGVYTECQIGSREVSTHYAAAQVVTVYSDKIDRVRASQSNVAELGKKGLRSAGMNTTRKHNSSSQG